MKFLLIQKVILFAFFIAEANADVEQVFSQVFNFVDKERYRLGIATLCGLLIRKNYLPIIG